MVVLRYFVAVLMLAGDKTRDCAAAPYVSGSGEASGSEQIRRLM
jgi:hypothetical protein